MAVTTRGKRQDTPDADALAELAGRVEQLERIVTTWLRIEARDKVRLSVGHQPASFRVIVVNELRIATHEEAVAVEEWLTAHQHQGR